MDTQISLSRGYIGDVCDDMLAERYCLYHHKSDISFDVEEFITRLGLADRLDLTQCDIDGHPDDRTMSRMDALYYKLEDYLYDNCLCLIDCSDAKYNRQYWDLWYDVVDRIVDDLVRKYNIKIVD